MMSMPFSLYNKNRHQNEKIGLEDDASKRTSTNDRVRIAIVGGGIAGVTAAHAIAKRLHCSSTPASSITKQPEIIVFEADQPAANVPFQSSPPQWSAATARNANSIVPGAAMHIMSQRSTLWQIASDTVSEWGALKYEQTMQWLGYNDNDRTLNSDNFQVPPPYFAFHVLQCLGMHVSWPERRSFLTFFRRFLVSSILTGPAEADVRAKFLVQLANANRASLLSDWETLSQKDRDSLGMTRGCLSLHRSLTKANGAVQEAEQFGEQAEVLPWDQALELEPHLKNLPTAPLYAVHRPDDVVANCLMYTQHLKHVCEKSCLWTELGRNQRRIKKQNVFVSQRGRHEVDYVLLAAGINTPLFAQQLDAGKYCPTYPLRGYSFTLYVDETQGSKQEEHNVLNRPISLDQMYCTSVSPTMARLAGFGELVGYRKAATYVPSVAPRVMVRYAQALFPEAKNVTADLAVQCFRPMSPDDLPIVGKVSAVPGLFLHHGHGTLGWTLSMATAECVAQALCDEVAGNSCTPTFELPDQSLLDRQILSPDRFA